MLDRRVELVGETPRMEGGRLVMGFSGWMDGGEVSTGTIEYLVRSLDARPIGTIRGDDFMVYNLPGEMEFASMFRPGAEIVEGQIVEWEETANGLWYDEGNRLLLLSGKEPHLQWPVYAELLFEMMREMGIGRVYFVGSYAGLVPHTREPRVTATVSHERLLEELGRINTKPATYQGPAGFGTYLNYLAARKHVEMISLVTEIPPYIQGRNPRCIEAALRRLGTLLEIGLELEGLRQLGDELEAKLDQVVQEKPEIVEHIQKLEENYDQELFETDMSDLRDWLQNQGIRLD